MRSTDRAESIETRYPAGASAADLVNAFLYLQC